MRILSYRGPSDPGGVASTVSQIFDMDHDLNEW